MAKNTEGKVMQFVEKELEANPEIETSELHEKAKKVHSSVGKLSLRQFNARYPLQVKRRQSLARPSRRRRKTVRAQSKAQASRSRDSIRAVFLRFASDLSAAEERKDLVQVVAQVDRYVDEVLDLAKK